MIKKLFTTSLAILILFATSNCAIAKRTKKMSQLELREMQTRIFDTPDTTRVMKSAINTLQDSGFVIQEIDTDLGFIRAQKTFKKHHIDKKRIAGWSIILALTTARPGSEQLSKFLEQVCFLDYRVGGAGHLQIVDAGSVI